MQRYSCLGPVLFRGRSVEHKVLWPTMDPDCYLLFYNGQTENKHWKKNDNNERQILRRSKSGCFRINSTYLLKSLRQCRLQGSGYSRCYCDEVVKVDTWNHIETSEKKINLLEFTLYLKWKMMKKVPGKLLPVKSSLAFTGSLLHRLLSSFSLLTATISVWWKCKFWEMTCA